MALHTNISASDIRVLDGRDSFETSDKVSRLAIVQWSRVLEPGLLGYNVYRKCSFWYSETYAIYGQVAMSTFACEPEWVRLNPNILSPDVHEYSDSHNAGLPGTFLYIVRPVFSDGAGGLIEGSSSKIVMADLFTIDDSHVSGANIHVHEATGISTDDPDRNVTCSSQNKGCSNALTRPCFSDSDCLSGGGCVALGFCHNVVPPVLCSLPTQCPSSAACDISPAAPNCLESHSGYVPFGEGEDEVLNDANHGINTRVRGAGSPAGPPQPVPSGSVHVRAWGKAVWVSPFTNSVGVAQVSWDWGATIPPSDLAGFHIEAAGSPNGPWQRLTSHPVAWWVNRYTVQGVTNDFDSDQFNPRVQCLNYRVIAVDEDGNESASMPARLNPTATCSAPPDAPTNLRASAHAAGACSSTCSTQLDWDGPTGQDYYIHYLSLTSVPYSSAPFFREVHVGSPTTFAFTDCAFPSVTLHAFYVTARSASGVDSPRSNVVFWDCDPTNLGYANLILDDASPDAIASASDHSAKASLACWLTDGADTSDRAGDVKQLTSARASVTQTTAPMVRLGSTANPAWEVYALHTDHLGNVRAETRDMSNTASVVRHNYFPFGEEVSPTLSFNTHQYTGHERDKATGLDYMKARYYENSLPRFLSVDPVGGTATNPQSWNRYPYANNNPIIFNDPTGMSSAGRDASLGYDGLFRSTGLQLSFAESIDGAPEGATEGSEGKESGKDPTAEPDVKPPPETGYDPKTWKWVPPSKPDGIGKWVPQGRGGPQILWDPTGHGVPHFDLDPGNGKRERFTPDGRRLVIGPGRQVKILPKPEMMTSERIIGTVVIYEVLKWGIATALAPETFGGSFGAAALAP